MERFEEFDLVGKDLYSLGLVDSSGGSLSVRSGDKILITRKNAMLAHLREEDILEVPLEGEGATDESASKELPVHRAIYRETAFNAVIAANPPYSVAVSLTAENKIVPADQKGQSFLRGVPVVRTRDKLNFNEMVKMLPSIYKSGYMVSVVREYGSFAVGANLMEALQYTTGLERSCKIIAINKLMTPPEVKREPIRERRSAIPPSIGVMDRSRGYKRGLQR